MTLVEQLLTAIRDAIGANAETINIASITCDAVNRSFHAPDMPVPDGFFLQMIAWPGNPVASLVYVSFSDPAARDIGQVWPLLPGATLGLRLKNANVLYFAATVAGCRVNLTAEKRR